MATERKNFLLGRGERLTGKVSVPRGSGPKYPPYGFEESQARLAARATKTVAELDKLPSSACPGGQAVVAIELHPRYLSKSDFPNDLLRATNLVAVGSRSVRVVPERWGTRRDGTADATRGELSSMLYVAGARSSLRDLAGEIRALPDGGRAGMQLATIEDLHAIAPEEKLRGAAFVVGSKAAQTEALEVVLHTAPGVPVKEKFIAFARELGAEPDVSHFRQIGALLFAPLRARPGLARDLAQFAFVRVVRGMPKLRPIDAGITRSVSSRILSLPSVPALSQHFSAVVFDGGLPPGHGLDAWVRTVEPTGIGAPVPQFMSHGLKVTSSLLFGNLKPNAVAPTPVCHVEHVRVLDHVSTNDFGLVDVLDRIVSTLKADHLNRFDLINISLGPDLPAEDDEVTAWTSALDELGIGRVITVAAGNDGMADAGSGLNRIQVPSDGVNLLAVGACDDEGANWKRAEYSSVGPGRSPGIVKPDGVAFGGSDATPFFALANHATLQITPEQGTSFAAPLVLRSAAAVKAALGPTSPINALGLRALLIHRAEGKDPTIETGWGRFSNQIEGLLTSSDFEVHVLYQGDLQPGVHVRAPIPLPREGLQGMVTITTTICIASELDPEHASSYTRSGVEVAFRPHRDRMREDEDGNVSEHAKTQPFFSESKIYRAPEYELRESGKWEPCKRGSVRKQAQSLLEPCLDLYYHHREDGGNVAVATLKPMPYAMVVTISAPKVPDLYDRVVRAYAGRLEQMVPIRPLISIR